MASQQPLRIVVLDRDTFPTETVLRPLDFAHEFRVYERTVPAQVADRIADADIVITNKVPISAPSLATATNLRFIAVAATGYDVVDITACKQRGIDVSNIRNYAANTVPEHTFALIFALRRSIVAYRNSVAGGDWQRAGQFCYFDYPIHDLAGSTIGIIGDGVLGQAVARMAHALGMKVLFADRKGETHPGVLYTNFETVLATSDIITLHCPLLPETRNLIARSEFALMKRRPLLINTARGGLVDENALCDALESGQIAGAGFDVVTCEPPPENHPFMRLTGRPDFILTPHVAWASREAIQSLADQLMENVELWQRQTPRNLVT
ncbi:D-2-hydroxyacid dehydrogenase [Muricoccus pecuniae]|uniref:Glycerate dehydrogenase n=1 Tax=Muricoccus pecuniae TaxID=693023 RepID=A0A840YMY3_9PROT|nr:D-2-hydroxyacid dehydrogenase [Roseomonas pecuniae]MBB5696164.1 glycerate dehydrogenase [Roseomonas pecuniae]